MSKVKKASGSGGQRRWCVVSFHVSYCRESHHTSIAFQYAFNDQFFHTEKEALKTASELRETDKNLGYPCIIRMVVEA